MILESLAARGARASPRRTRIQLSTSVPFCTCSSVGVPRPPNSFPFVTRNALCEGAGVLIPTNEQPQARDNLILRGGAAERRGETSQGLNDFDVKVEPRSWA